MSEAPVLRTALSISGASCQGCAKKIRNALEPLAGSTELVEVNLEAQTVALPEGVDVELWQMMSPRERTAQLRLLARR